ncbi:MAG: helix-turn-helix domain-containing protein [Patescibacteria group bacterium]|nr:helix-turn-helix domain-containing protein [Patescibacteria group bacterium]
MLTAGEILKREREKKGLTLLEIEKKIKIREKFLKAIEEGNWHFFSSKTYIEGIIKNYALFLSINPQKILAFFRRDYEKEEMIRFKEKVSHHYLNPNTKKILFTGFAIVFTIFLFYFGYQLKLYFSPPKIEIISPKINKFKRERKIKIIGQTEKEAILTIGGERVYQDKKGCFEYELFLNLGRNEVLIEAIGANGKKTILRKTYYLTK